MDPVTPNQGSQLLPSVTEIGGARSTQMTRNNPVSTLGNPKIVQIGGAYDKINNKTEPKGI